MIASAIYSDINGTNAGICYIFKRTGTTWSSAYIAETATIENDAFGCSVGISGNNIVVGAYDEDTGALNAGTAYFYELSEGGFYIQGTDQILKLRK